MAKTYAEKPKDRKKPARKPGIPDLIKTLKKFFLQANNKYTTIVMAKKNWRQKSICHSVAPSNDLTIKPPKLKHNAPRKIKNFPGILFKKVNLYALYF